MDFEITERSYNKYKHNANDKRYNIKIIEIVVLLIMELVVKS